MFRRLAVLSLLALAVSAAAEDAPLNLDTTVAAKQTPAKSSDKPADRQEDIRLAMCGLEADAGATNLDAGLIDFNVPDPARAAGGHAADDRQRVGQNVPDYRSSVFLGMTLGYHF